jgi:hypothetical protein
VIRESLAKSRDECAQQVNLADADTMKQDGTGPVLAGVGSHPREPLPHPATILAGGESFDGEPRREQRDENEVDGIQQ